MVFLVAVEALLPIGWAFPWSVLRATVFAVDDIAGGLLAVVSPLCVAPLLFGMSVAALYQIDVGLFTTCHGPEVLLGCFICYCNLSGLFHCQGVALCDEFLSDLLGADARDNFVTHHFLGFVVVAVFHEVAEIGDKGVKRFSILPFAFLKNVPSKYCVLFWCDMSFESFKQDGDVFFFWSSVNPQELQISACFSCPNQEVC